MAALPPEKLAATRPEQVFEFCETIFSCASFPFFIELFNIDDLVSFGDGRGHSLSPPFPDLSLREAMPRLFTLIHLYIYTSTATGCPPPANNLELLL